MDTKTNAEEMFGALEGASRKKALTAFRRAKTRVLNLFGAESAARLAADFALTVGAVRKASRLFKNAKRARVWVGGNPMSAGRYALRQKRAGANVGKLGVVPGAFILKNARAGAAVFAPEGADLPAWATFSGKAWTPRGDKRTLRKISVASPKDFKTRYAPDVPALRAFFESEFAKEFF